MNDKSKTRFRRYLPYALEALVFSAILAAFFAYKARDLLPTGGEEPAPALRAPTLDGGFYDLEREVAPVTLVYFFAPWCHICAASSGNINYLRRLRGERDLRILMVALDWQTRDEVQAYVDRHEITVPVLLGDRQVASAWNIYAFPSYYILDRELRIAQRDLGYSTLAGLWWRSSGIGLN